MFISKIKTLLKKRLKAKKDGFIPSKTKHDERPFVIIANNCWGAGIYKTLKTEYNTPFVGLFIVTEDYIKLLENFDFYFSQELRFSEKSKWRTEDIKYPIGLLGDIEIHFMHYPNKEEAAEKWTRRTERMQQVADKSRYFFKVCDRDNGTPELLERFHKLPFKNKLSFALYNLDTPNHIVVKENENNKAVPDGLKLYNITNKYTDLTKWLNTGIVVKKKVK